MIAPNPIFPTFIHELWLKIGGVFICDNKRLDEFIGGKTYGMDILNFLASNENKEKICTDGIGIPVNFVDAETLTVVLRHSDEKAYLKTPPKIISSGWVLFIENGKLVLSDFSSLMFWDPLEDVEDRYTFVDIPIGWYIVEIIGGINCKNPDVLIADEFTDDYEYVLEFVFSPVKQQPKFLAEINTAFSFHDIQNIPSASLEVKSSFINGTIDVPDKNALRLLLSRLNKHAFKSFITELFSDFNEEFVELSEIGEDVFNKALLDSYGGSLHSVYLLQYLPLGLIEKPNLSCLTAESSLSEKLEKIKLLYQDEYGYFGMVSESLIKAQKLRSLGFILNLNGLEPALYKDTIIPAYENLLKEIGIQPPILLVGTCDSFLDNNPVRADEAFRKFLMQKADGISISFNNDQVEVSNFSYENSFVSGVFSSRKQPYEPIYINKLKQKADTILEFENLLHPETKEENLEKFLVRYYKDIFGAKYDRIETQIWLKFPGFDIVGKERRLDIFLRNSVANDWELFEIKRVIPLTGSYRDIPVISKEIHFAIQQVKNYERILNQIVVKDKLAQYGIEYFEPSLHLVVGKTPQISRAQWRWLVSSNSEKVKIVTYDDLLGEMKARLSDKLDFLSNTDR